MDNSVKEKWAKSLTAETTELIPYLPYLLQDLWEIGSSPEDIVKLISLHIPNRESFRVLDLACGKGVVSVIIAKELNVHVKGIDIMSEFISYAEQKAKEYNVENLCCFALNDINVSVNEEKDYD